MIDHPDRTTESLLARRELAEKATPGPWIRERGFLVYGPWRGRPVSGKEGILNPADAAHIAANSPDVVMDDIDEILRLRAEVEFWRQETQDVRENFERTLQCERDKTDRLEREADWLALVLANAGCGIPLTEYIGEAVNGMSPPAPEHWREAARKAVETSHEN